MKSVFLQRKEGTLTFAWIFTGLILASIGLGIAPLPITVSTNSAIYASSLFQAPKVATSAPSIFINGTDTSNDWDNCPWVNGTGTYDNPFVIQDLIIDGERSGSCISIVNTQEYFHIENCTLMNSGTRYTDAGISLVNSSNGLISKNLCTQNPNYGIFLYSANNNTLEFNNCSMNHDGIYLGHFSQNNTIRGNTCGVNWRYGILICLSSSYNRLSGNTCAENDVGICLENSYCNQVEGNLCVGNYIGITPASDDGSVLIRNNCTRNTYGIVLNYVRDCTVTENNCTGNAYGISLENSKNNLIYTNNCTGSSSRPIIEINSDGNNIHHNWFCTIPLASFNWNTTRITTEMWVAFNDTTLGDHPFQYEWNFGDGTENSTLKNPMHQYHSGGYFMVTLTVTDFDGDMSVYQVTVNVHLDSIWVAIIIIAVCAGIAGIAILMRKWEPALERNASRYKWKIVQKWALAKTRFVEKRTRRAEAERARIEADRRREEELASQLAVIERQQRDTEEQIARQSREAEELRIQQNRSKVEHVILEIAPQFSKLQVGEIAERSGVPDEGLIINVVHQMIARKQIEATYFKSTRSVAFQQHPLEKPPPSQVLEQAEIHAEVRRQFEYVGGKVRLKVKITNIGRAGLLRVKCMLNVPDSFHLLRVEPTDYSTEGTMVKLQDLLPKEEKSVAYVLEPMICGKEQFSGTVTGVDAMGDPFAAYITPLEVDVRCPLFATPEEANLPLLKHMVLDLPVKSERVFYLPETLSPVDAYELAKAAISERDVRFVGTVGGEDQKEGDPFDKTAWFYGTTKVEKKRYVLSAAVSEKDRIIRLASACDDEAGCTGYLAETGAAVRRELVRRGAFESEADVIELVCEKCGATLPRAPTITSDVRCPECKWPWRLEDFFR